MKVAHLVQFFEPGYVGGMQSYVAQLARRQQKEGLDVSVLTVALPRRLRRANTQKMTEQWNGENGSLRVVARRPWGLWYRTPMYPAAIADVRRLDADVVHLHGPSPWYEAALLLAGPLRGQLAFTLHNTFPTTTLLQRWLGWIAQRLLHKTLDRADAIIAPHADFLHHLVPEHVARRSAERLHFVPPGVDRYRFRPLDLPRDEESVLFVAHLRPEKGLHVLVEAMTRLPHLRLDVLTTVSYEGSYYTRVRREAEARLGSRVRFLLNPDPVALLHAYNRAACVVAPSLGLESWNLVLLEAAACGAACVCTELPGLTWADFAVTAPPGNAERLAQAIQTAVAQRQELGERARCAVDAYSWERTCQETLAAYQYAARVSVVRCPRLA